MSSDNSKPRLLFVIDTKAIGGTEKYLLDLSQKLKRKYSVTLLCPKYKVLDSWVEKFREYDINIVRARIYNFFDIKNIIHFLILFRKTEIIHFILPCPANNRLAILCAKLIGVPIRVATLQLVVPPNSKFTLRNLYTKLTIRFAYSFLHKIIAVSRNNQRQLIDIYKIRKQKIKVIYNSIDVRRYLKAMQNSINDLELPFSKDIFYIALVARLHPQKGHQYLINAAPKIISAYPTSHFLFIGDGEERERLTRMINDKNLNPYFTFLGVNNHIDHILPKISMLVLPSLFEGFPFVILEAMAAGKPVVASNIGGIDESIEDGITGFLVSPKNLNDLADAVIFLMKNNALAKKMGRMGQERVKKLFDLPIMVTKTNRVYQSLISEHLR